MSDLKNGSKYYLRSANVARLFRYLVTLMFIVFLLMCIFIFGKDITAENIQLLAKYITLNDGSASLYTDEFSITADDDSDVFMLSDNLVVTKHNNISLYDLGGQKLFSFDYSYSLPSCVHDDRNVLVHDISGKELSVFNTFSKVKSLQFSQGITSAHISDKGIVAVSGEESYRSALYVYNNDYKEIFKWLSSEYYITDAVLSSDGGHVLASSAEASDGMYSCGISVFDITSESVEPLYKAALFNELPVEIGYSDDGKSVYVITDSNIHFFTPKLSLIKTYKFNQSKVDSYYLSDDMIILTERNNLAGNSMSLIGLSMKGDTIFNINISDEISDIAIGRNKIFALGKNRIFEISAKDGIYAVVKHFDVDIMYNHIVCDSDDNCYVVSNSRVRKIDFIQKKDNSQQ